MGLIETMDLFSKDDMDVNWWIYLQPFTGNYKTLNFRNCENIHMLRKQNSNESAI